MREAKTVIEELRLSPHPEGGWFRETWRAPEEEGERAAATAIYFLLLSVSVSPKGPVREVRLGPDVIAGDRPHYVVGAHEWQAAAPLPGTVGYTLVSCVVSPGFRFSGFTLAPPNWRPGAER